MTPNSATSAAPSRRSFLASTAVAAAVVAGGVPLLSACGGSQEGRKEGTTSGKDAQKILPTFVASSVVAPDIPAKNGAPAGFTKAIPTADLKTSVPKKLGSGGKLKVMSPFWGTPPKGDNPYYTAMNEAAGVEVTWQNQDGVTYDQKLGAVLASSDIPDVVVVPAWNLMGRIPSAINAKFADLGPYLSGDKVKEYPNLAAVPTEAWQRGIFGGQLRAIPMPAPYVTGIAPMYRKDLFEKNGYDVPTSPDAFLSWAKEATDAKSKLWACDDMKWAALHIYGVFPGGDKALWWNMVDGKLVNRVETDEYLEALEWTRKLYAAGVVHPDALNVKAGGNAGNRFTAGEVLVYSQNISDWWGKTAEQRTQNPDFEMAAFDYFGADGGDPTLWADQPAGIFTFISKKASAQQIKDFLALCNYCAAPYGTKEFMLTAYGVEGTDYETKKGLPVKTTQGINEVNSAYDLTGNPAPYVAYVDLPEVTKGIVEWQQRMGAFTKKTSFFGLTVTEPNRWANLADNFEQLEDDIVRGRKKISDMQQAVTDWKSKGGDDLRDWYKKLLDDTGSAN
ncbi:extracellular solute-binding protein [Streptomyces europaeiscabiei]|uniref:extracellular solute-binding protein n=1 Tax=Streptomyces europaeiscabiei TaxID=146819 RepID=UPI0029B61B25|nr:extracellular solute-binding protein [Streptomyces europaeiscabiei]MDX3586411.1 extracellular solute-binding protein [Streptomyces europaeiscabiei]MDX3617577.1 extracellular solute-binding protein [Streptomyces europaeiscabiei]MDX3635031.1 extracellular solute-binding protein [Streptomyces europaeiscabiei]MDX3651713.1 extracellular solute-binding protein [Streptomyces europaeiscabiei]WUD35773.1 extracellular solute-binding protein [Streptomyces europaeiscabiei]